jgi:hypothetical protein
MRRGVRDLLSALRKRDLATTLVTTDRWTLAEELWSFGEDSLSLASLELADEDLTRVWVLAGRLYQNAEARSAGEAVALAAVAVIEGAQRPLARKRRRRQADRLRFGQTPEERLADIHRIEESESFPEAWR